MIFSPRDRMDETFNKLNSSFDMIFVKVGSTPAGGSDMDCIRKPATETTDRSITPHPKNGS